MKACVLSDWKHLEIQELPLPELSNGEALIEVIYGGVCGSDVTVTNHKHPTATIPRILCHEILGIVKEIKSEEPVNYRVGDRVVVFPLSYCGECVPCLTGHTSACSHLRIAGVHSDGGFAEYAKFPVKSLIPVPDDIPDEIAALIEPLSVAFHANARAGTKPGDSVLVIGGGPIGLLCALTARYFGARVLLSELKTDRLALARSMGIEAVSPREIDLTAVARKKTSGTGFDVILEVTGSQPAYDTMIELCRECGTIVPVAIPSSERSFRTNLFILKEIHLLGTRCCPKIEFERTVDMVREMYRHGESYHLENMIAKILPLEQCAEGIAEQGSGSVNGKILIRIGKT